MGKQVKTIKQINEYNKIIINTSAPVNELCAPYSLAKRFRQSAI